MRIFTLVGVLSIGLCIPGVVFAHATPIELSPESSSVVVKVPKSVEIRFSEKLERGASRIEVRGPSGEIVSHTSVVSSEDAHTLATHIVDGGAGLYQVMWSVVSSDDGHFTRGAHAFAVGSGVSVPSSVAPPEIVTITTAPEAIAMTVELYGNGLFWASLVVLLLGGVALTGVFVSRIVLVACALVVFGGIAQFVIKSVQLSTLHTSSLYEAVSMYVSTTAGSATLIRILAALVFSAVFWALYVYRPRVLEYRSVVVLLAIPLLVFAYCRALVSHATANPFYPDFSILVNIVHLIEKDGWAGIATCIFLFVLFNTRRGIYESLIDRLSQVLTVNMGFLSVTACYIIWLHLKSFENIFTTAWGTAFVYLALSAVLLVATRVAHVALGSLRGSFRSYLYGAELSAVLLVLYFSSVVIITTPPLYAGSGEVLIEKSQGVTARVQASSVEDGFVLLTLENGNHEISEPTVFLNRDSAAPEIITLQKRFNFGYVFPSVLIQPGMDMRLEVVVPQIESYDARFDFTVTSDTFILPTADEREFNGFAMVFIMLGFGMLLFSVILSRMMSVKEMDIAKPSQLILGLCIGFVFVSSAIYFVSPRISGGFKALCLADGNAWHTMLPTKGGVQTSSMPKEGCMLFGGLFHITDKREYEYLKNPAPTSVKFEDEMFMAGVPGELRFTINNKDGSPASLFVEHERMAHVVIASSDMKDFFHVHPLGSEDSSSYNESGVFEVPFTFPRAGTYIVAVDYLTGLAHRSETHVIEVGGSNAQEQTAIMYQDTGMFNGYDVRLRTFATLAREPATLVFDISKKGEDVRTLNPYLGAAMHVAVIKNDLSEFMHTHGEVHLGTVVPKKATHVHAPPPQEFGPSIESHLVFPEPGLYTVFGEFKEGNQVTTARFTVRVN